MSNCLYFLEQSGRVHGRRCQWFLEVDRDENSRAAVLSLLRTGEVEPLKILEVDEDAGTCRDVTDEMVAEAMEGVGTGEPVDHQALAFDHARDQRKQARNNHVAEPILSILNSFSAGLR